MARRRTTIAAVFVSLLLGRAAFAQQSPSPRARNPEGSATGKSTVLQPDTDLIDAPTAGVLDHGAFANRARFFSNGGVADWVSFGVYPRVHLGASFNVDQLLGTGSPVKITRPELQLKFRFFDGERILPALAIGYDGQGYLYNRPDKRYNQRQRGVYLVGSQEIGVPGLQAHAGVNISDFDSNSIFGLLATSFNIADKVLLMAEWDNISNYVDSRVNMGLRVYLTPNFSFDFAGRGVGQGGHFTDGVARGAERIAQFKYTGSF